MGTEKGPGKFLEKSWKFVSEERYEPWEQLTSLTVGQLSADSQWSLIQTCLLPIQSGT